MKGRRAAAAAGAWVVLSIVAVVARLVSLRALPIFGDEAIFLRLAGLTAKAPFSRVWISLQESQPPLHVWLLALFRPLSPDPVLAGRLLSVLSGVLCVPAAACTARRTIEAFGADSGEPAAEARVAAWTTAALLALCPFFVFSERLARVDALFLLESILAAGLAVAAASASGARALPLAALFGALMGLTMLTRQAVSYPLWALPPVAWALLPESRRGIAAGRLLAALVLAATVAAALWIPMLLAPGQPDTLTRIFHSADYRPAMSAVARIRMTLAGARLAVESFWVYLTPPVCVLAAMGVAGLAALASRRRLLVYLAFWEAILLLPAAAFAANYFPRYALPAAVPVCVLAAAGAVRLGYLLAARLYSAPARAALAGLFVLVLAPSVFDVARGDRDWRDWRLLPIDRLQFLGGPPAGFASEAAAGALRRIAAGRPEGIAVLTPGISGNPTDAVWVLLGGDPRIRLSYAPDALARPLLPDAGADGTRRLPGDTRDPRASAVALPAGRRVFAVVPDPLFTRAGWVDAVPFLSRLNPRISEVARFRNPDEPGTPANGVVVVELP